MFKDIKTKALHHPRMSLSYHMMSCGAVFLLGDLLQFLPVDCLHSYRRCYRDFRQHFSGDRSSGRNAALCCRRESSQRQTTADRRQNVGSLILWKGNRRRSSGFGFLYSNFQLPFQIMRGISYEKTHMKRK